MSEQHWPEFGEAQAAPISPEEAKQAADDLKSELVMIGFYARQIQSKAQFDAIMADVDPRMKSRVKELLAPLLSFSLED